MKKRILSLCIAVLLCFSLAACQGGATAYSPAKFLLPVPDNQCLYYDPDVKTVYIVYHEWTGNQGYGYMSPYYAANGLPYLYDIANKRLVENKVGGSVNEENVLVYLSDSADSVA